MSEYNLNDIYRLIKQVAQEVKDITIDLNEQKTEITLLNSMQNSTHETVAKMDKMLTEGNGRQSILTRLALLEDSEQGREKDEHVDSGRRWQIILVVVTCTISICGSVLYSSWNQDSNPVPIHSSAGR